MGYRKYVTEGGRLLASASKKEAYVTQDLAKRQALAFRKSTKGTQERIKILGAQKRNPLMTDQAYQYLLLATQVSPEKIQLDEDKKIARFLTGDAAIDKDVLAMRDACVKSDIETQKLIAKEILTNEIFKAYHSKKEVKQEVAEEATAS